MRKPLLLLALTLSACTQPVDVVTDQHLRHRIFTDCLDRAAKITPSTVADRGSWSEVVEKCDNAAYYQSRRNATGPNRHML